MRHGRTLFAIALGLGLSVWPSFPLHAGMSPEEQARRSAIVATVGPTRITAGELEDRLAAVPRFQLKVFGDTPDAIRRTFFAEVLLPEVLYALDAEKQKLATQLPTSNKILRAKANATTRALTAGSRTAASIGLPEVEHYYQANRSKYDSPERLYLFRILCATRQEAEQVLALAKREPTLEAFTKLAHDSSIDKATNLRAGNLGYLTPDGTSSEAGLAVDPVIVAAAAKVKDGEFVPVVVPERAGKETAPGGAPGGKEVGFSVIWRRGSIPANHRSVAEVAAQIRESIWKEEAEEMAKKHLAELRKAHLTELNESLLNGIEITPSEGDVVTRRRPGEVLPLTQTGRNAPRPN
jgi:peptidyl-prolyl cis-trans isomerase C